MKQALLLFFGLTMFNLSAQGILGKWKTIDDETGEEKSIVNIYEVDGKVYGNIIEILNPKKKNSRCTKCEGNNKDKPIVGMQIIDGLTKNDDVYEGGTILNPSNGKVYKCRLKLEDDSNKLQVRGYVAFFYKTQYWKRVN
ncbi:uncharacterized protein DUF2147 [Winogradskyella wandonensis]|uniref:Uncharacterized protein DUF2147 n=1 Tax=Winogradskyella wandonensis TaxID=1442586 RepID=A0A4R1KJU5_9FLAO|nr:DUF2147 domain-containing protein [Winogradskyella wandonensis]TCK64670.1 uncharacterized protein DUF2147 [Winogradskyella wandonensis]